MTAGCVFCGIVVGRELASIVARDAATAGAVFTMTARIARAVKRAMQPDGVTILQNNESAGGQDVFHLHVHVIPRRHGDAWFQGYIARPPSARAALDALAACIAAMV